MSNAQNPRLGLYVHWPFCTRICPYCDFNVYRNRDVDEAAWKKALTQEIAYWGTRTKGRQLSSIYFGGGTPSLASPDLIGTVIDAAAETWGIEPGAEITLEANPTDAEQQRFADFRTAGVNRLSLGIQAFEDDALKFLGRNHTGEESKSALELALTTFENVTFDLIYALPVETPQTWRQRLTEALQYDAPHLSAYQLTIEPGTAFERATIRGDFAEQNSDSAGALYEITEELAEAAGLAAYEVSNYARAGRESQHNLIYWRCEDYVGIGPGAHGRLTTHGTRIATETVRQPIDYLKAAHENGAAVTVQDELTAEQVLMEKLSMGLRLKEGARLFRDDVTAISDRLTPLVKDGLLKREGQQLTATKAGRQVLNGVLAELLT